MIFQLFFEILRLIYRHCVRTRPNVQLRHPLQQGPRPRLRQRRRDLQELVLPQDRHVQEPLEAHQSQVGRKMSRLGQA